jgi:NADPH:quinone reductase-like Zn-dependent oxidoreductase
MIDTATDCMQALVLDAPGTPDTLRLAEVPIPQPESDEVRVRVHAVGLNPIDYKLAATGFTSWTYPFILGLDIAGTIDVVGSDVKEWQVGDSVYYHGNLARPGGYAEFTVTPTHVLASLPRGLAFAEAAALPCAGFTAYTALYRKLNLQSGQTILIHAGAGGVGGFAIQLAHLARLEVFTTCSFTNADYVRELGATHVIDYHTENISQRVRELTQGRGVDFIIDTLGGKSTTEALELLAFGGHLICVAGLPDFSRIKPFVRAISVHEVALGGAYLYGDRVAQVELAQMAQELGTLASDGRIRTLLSETVTLADIPDALRRLSEGHVRGKVVATLVR